MKHEAILKLRSSMLLVVLFILPIFVCISTLEFSTSILSFIAMAVITFFVGKVVSINLMTRLLGSREKKEMLNYVTSFISPSRLLSSENPLEKIARETYPNLTEIEIKDLVAESFAIFKDCEKIPHDEDFQKRVSEKYPFLSQSTLSSLQGAVHYMQVK